jgi:HD-like signal output (HDOD) protein
VSLLQLEQQLFDNNHCKIGLMLMEKWKMPDYICASVAHHHNETYEGVATLHSQLTLVADRLLKTHGIGDAQTEHLPQAILDNLGLSEAQVYAMLDKTINGSKDLDSMANQLAA